MMPTKRIIFSALFLLACTKAHAEALDYRGVLNGANESPTTSSPGTGTTFVTLDSPAHTLSVSVNFSGLVGTSTAAHIHCCVATAGAGTAIVATRTPSFSNFPLGVTAGSYSATVYDLTLASSWNPAFITANGGTTSAAEAALIAGLAASKAYLDIHSSVYPGGEIRAFLSDTIFANGFDIP